MPELILTLEIDPVTGRKRVLVGYHSDPDALPAEHEEAHRQLVERLLERGLVATADEVVVTRAPARAPAPAERAAEPPRRAVEEGT